MGLHHQSYLGCSFNRCAGGVGTRCGVPRRPPSARGAPSELACFPSARGAPRARASFSSDAGVAGDRAGRPCPTRWKLLRTGAGPACNTAGTCGVAGQPKHQLSGAASRPLAPSPRVVSRPTCGASPMCNAELFVYFAFLVSVDVVACIFASCVSLVDCDHAIPALSAVLLAPLSVHRATTQPFSRPSVAPLQ